MTNRGIEILSPASHFPGTDWLFEETRQTRWTAEENKRFEKALALYDKDIPDRWIKVATTIPGKTVADVIRHYEELVDDVSDIEAGLIPIPGYATSDCFTLDWGGDGGCGYVVGGKRGSAVAAAGSRLPPPQLEKERKKGVPWSEEEHRQFLMGLKKYGKGDWRNISRNFVTTRTPTQVASHAQKYFIRQLNGGKDKRRSSIHDITTVNVPDVVDSSVSSGKLSSFPVTNNSSRNFDIFLQQNAGNGFAFASPFGSCDAFHLWNEPNRI